MCIGPLISTLRNDANASASTLLMQAGEMPRTRGFTLIELLVVIGIIGLLVGLLLPAVQMARESARRSQCSHNLKGMGLAIHNFEDAHRKMPLGGERLSGTDHAWSSLLLPHLEQMALFQQFDWKKAWNAPSSNQTASTTNLSIYRCPSAVQQFDGKQDYGGLLGTTLTSFPLGEGPYESFGCGAMVSTSTQQRRTIPMAAITDGLSNTICIGESVDRNPEASGRWACGLNCFSQTEALSQRSHAGDMYSQHPSTVGAAFVDGHVQYLDLHIDPVVLGSLCTRNGAEVVSGDSY